jgi:GNAT superfamily N-acetyltransferase
MFRWVAYLVPHLAAGYHEFGGQLPDRVAVRGTSIIRADTPDEVALRSMAVAERYQGRGLGRALVRRAVEECRTQGARTLLVAMVASAARSRIDA